MKNALLVIFMFIFSFSARSGNDSLKIDYHIQGRLFTDAGVYTHRPAASHHRTGITEARLGANIRIYPKWYAQIELSFSKNKVALTDAYVEYAEKSNYFRAGHMVGTFSIDQSNSTSYYFFHTGANIAETLFPGRRVGVSYTRSVPAYYVSAGAFCGDGLNFDKETIQGYNFTARAVWRPYYTEKNLVHFGTGAFFKVPDKNAETGRRSLSVGSSGVTYLPAALTVGITFDDVSNQTQANLECLLYQGRWIVQSEYLAMRVKQKTAPAVYTAKGGYVQGGFLLKGSSFGYDPIDAMPTIPGDPNSLLLVCRYNCTDLNDASADLSGGKQHDVSVGINYYFNRYICSKLNYSHLWVDSGPEPGKYRFGMIQARLQVRF